MKKKNLFLSVLGASLGLTFAAGGTYALFTSESDVDITVTSGTVSVEASVENLATYSGEWDETSGAYQSKATETLGKFTNGGTAVVELDGSVTLDKISPMDKVEFDIVIENNSDIAIKQRVGFSVTSDEGLFNGLSLVADGEPLIAGYSNWEIVQVGASAVAKHVSIELPELAGNEYQGKNTKLKFSVEAIQGNAHTMDEVIVHDPTELASAIAEASENTAIKLAASETPYTIPVVSSSKQINIVGENKETTKIANTEAIGLSGSSINFENVTLVGGTADYKGFQHVASETYTNCIFTGKRFMYGSTTTFKSCTFVQETYEYCFWVYSKGETTFDDCIFNTLGKAAKVYNESTNVEDVFDVTFNNCVFNSSENTHNKPAIAVNSLGATYNIKVNNCTTTNFNFNDDAMETWYSTRMASASAAEKYLVGAEGQIDKITATIDGKTY